MFAAVDRVVEAGHDPRRFAADLLERLRDLIVLAVGARRGRARHRAARRPTSSSGSGCRRAASATPQLTRAADVVNAGLAEMRGAIAPRLLLELVCARVLLPGIDEDARGAHARLDRIERRLDVSGSMAEPTVRRAARRRPGAGRARRPRPPAAPGAAAAAAGRAPAPASRSARAVVEPPAPAGRGAASRAGAADPTDAAAEPPDRPAAGSREAADGPAAAGVDVQAVRQMWPEVVERVKEYKRVTWMLLMEQVQVASVDDRVLVLAFGNEGKRRNFSSSGHDEIVRQALIDVLGLDRRVDAVLDPSAAAVGSAARPRRRAVRCPSRAAPTSRRAARAASPPAPAQHRRRPAAEPQVDRRGRAARPVDPDRAPRGRLGRRRRRRRRGRRAGRDDLVARELGGTVIGEFGPG